VREAGLAPNACRPVELGGYLPLTLEDHAFTLVELLIVMLAIAVLLAIAIPTFLSTVATAHTTSAKSSLSGAIKDVLAIYTQDQGVFRTPMRGSRRPRPLSRQPTPI
jgi:prepilin-type N-terminal cleavage/methylation domain-containing protein